MSDQTALAILNGVQIAFFIVLALGVLGMFYTAMMHAFIGLPYVRTLTQRFPYIFDEIDRQIKRTNETIMVDLGSGYGHLLFEAERRGFKHLIGYEISPWHVWCAQIVARLKGSKVRMLREDFFKADFSNVDVFYFFLIPDFIAKVSEKIFREAKKGALVIALADKIEGRTPIKVITIEKPKINIYFYRVE